MGRRLLPLQLAVGVQDGCGIGARLAQVALDTDGDMAVEGGEEMCILQMELGNVFNLQA